MSDAPAQTLRDQADTLEYLVSRCVSRDGRVAEKTTLVLDVAEVEALSAISLRMRRMAPHEAAIRKVVTGK